MLTPAPMPPIRRVAARPAVVPLARTAAALLAARFRRAWAIWAVVAITLFGGGLRFYHLTFPALWNDEALVYWRVCGTYGQMLTPLRTDGFPPLHYSLYWALGSALDGTADAAARHADEPVADWAVNVGHDGLIAAHELIHELVPATPNPVGWTAWATLIGGGLTAVAVGTLATVGVVAASRNGSIPRRTTRAAIAAVTAAVVLAVAVWFVAVWSFATTPLQWHLGGGGPRPWFAKPWAIVAAVADLGHDGLASVHQAAWQFPALGRAAEWAVAPLLLAAAIVTAAGVVSLSRAGRLTRRQYVTAGVWAAVAVLLFAALWLAVLLPFDPAGGLWCRDGDARPWAFARLASHHLDLRLTPWVMRFIPALAGTLTIPAIYFLARQMLNRAVSVVAALFTACSAFMLFYSRDAKMYPDAWLAITVGVGCLLWWCRSGRSTAFLGWVAGLVAAVGLHASAAIIPGVTVVMFLTQRRVTVRRAAAVLAGVGLIYAGVVGYYFKFNQWIEREETSGWNTTGLGWVGEFFNGERTGPELARYGATAMVAGYEWPRDDQLDMVRPPLVEGPQTACWEIGVLLAAAALPWGLVRLGRRAGWTAPVGWRRWVFGPVHHGPAEPSPQPQWRTLLWLGLWIVPGGYAFYCTTIDYFSSPRRWLWELAEWADDGAGWEVGLAGGALTTFVVLAACNRRSGWPALARAAGVFAVVAALFGATYGVFVVMHNVAVDRWMAHNPWGALWLPRYLGFMWPAVGIAVAALLMRLPTRPVRVAAVGFLLIVNLGLFAMRMTMGTEPPIDVLAADVAASQPRDATVRTYNYINGGDIAVAGSTMGPQTRMASGRYYLQMETDRRPISPVRFDRSFYEYDQRLDEPYEQLRSEVRFNPQVRTVVIWTAVGADTPPAGVDPFRSTMAGFALAREDQYTVRIIWDWRERYKWVRREYRRDPHAAAGRPARRVPSLRANGDG